MQYHTLQRELQPSTPPLSPPLPSLSYPTKGIATMVLSHEGDVVVVGIPYKGNCNNAIVVGARIIILAYPTKGIATYTAAMYPAIAPQ